MQFLAFALLLFASFSCIVKITEPQRLQVKPFQKTSIMTTTIQTLTSGIQTASRRNSLAFYTVVVNGEDGNYQEFEIEASSEQEAHTKADTIAQSCMIDVTYVEVYKQ